MATSKRFSLPLSRLLARFPTRRELAPVFSVLLFFIFSWALYRMFYQVPSWLSYLSVGNVLVLSTYVLAFDLIETLIMLGFIILLSALLPGKIFKEKFVTQGSFVAFVLSFSAIMLQRNIGVIYDLDLQQVILYPLFSLVALIILIVLFSFVFDRFKWLPRLINSLADRMIAFAIIYVPISLVCLVIVIARNL